MTQDNVIIKLYAKNSRKQGQNPVSATVSATVTLPYKLRLQNTTSLGPFQGKPLHMWIVLINMN